MQSKKTLILQLLNSNRIMTMATNRSDGWPQATIVGYVNDGLLLYAFIARNSQKYSNVCEDPRVSISIGGDAKDAAQIKALSLSARASEVTDRIEFGYVATLRLKRYPEYASANSGGFKGDSSSRAAPNPPPSSVVLLRLTPEIFSVIDYSKGFGHSDLVTFSAAIWTFI